MNLPPSPTGIPLHPSSMSELDSLSDSDWLDIASGRDSDDNDSLSEQDSDRDEISSLPRSRRSSISNEDSMSSDVEAWEGFVSDSGEAVIGMYPVPLPSPLGAEPIALGVIPDNATAVDPAISDEERRVKEALDQSFVGTLSSSRSSAHTSIRDLRLSFPDPLTSSRNDLNRSYETVSSPTEAAMNSLVEGDANVAELAPIAAPPQLEDPGLFTTPVVQHQHQEAQLIEPKDSLEIVLYGSSSEIKWKFLQQFIEKAAMASGHVLSDSFRESIQTQSLSLIKPSGAFVPFFNTLDIKDRTNNDSGKLETDIFDSLERPSLAIVYLPTTQLPDLSWHSCYLPVLIPSVSNTDPELVVQTAEDDWDLLAVPADRTLNLGHRKSPIFDAEDLQNIDSTRLYEVLRNVGRDTKKVTALKPLTEQVKSMNAVTLFALMSIIMGFAFNTSFRSSPPTPTRTVNVPSSNTGQIWNFFAPQPNRSILALTGNQQTKSGSSGSVLSATPSLKDMALSVFNPGSTSLSVTSPPSAKSLSISSTSSNAIVKMTTTSPTANCRQCETRASSSTGKPSASTDMVAVPTSLTPSIYIRPSNSIITHTGSASTILLAGADRAAGISKSIVVPVASAAASINLNSVTEALDATTKALAEAVGSDLAELVEAADELLVSLREQRDSVIRQSKGKARAFGEQIQNLNEELVNRNERAKRRARELKKKGGEIVRGAADEFKKRTSKAKKRAKALRKSVVDGGTEAWKIYERSQADWEAALSGKASGDDKENAGAQPQERQKNSGAHFLRSSKADRKKKRASANIYV